MAYIFSGSERQACVEKVADKLVLKDGHEVIASADFTEDNIQYMALFAKAAEMYEVLNECAYYFRHYGGEDTTELATMIGKLKFELDKDVVRLDEYCYNSKEEMVDDFIRRLIGDERS